MALDEDLDGDLEVAAVDCLDGEEGGLDVLADDPDGLDVLPSSSRGLLVSRDEAWKGVEEEEVAVFCLEEEDCLDGLACPDGLELPSSSLLLLDPWPDGVWLRPRPDRRPSWLIPPPWLTLPLVESRAGSTVGGADTK